VPNQGAAVGIKKADAAAAEGGVGRSGVVGQGFQPAGKAGVAAHLIGEAAPFPAITFVGGNEIVLAPGKAPGRHQGEGGDAIGHAQAGNVVAENGLNQRATAWAIPIGDVHQL
ncbi:MAG: hypothetical protein ACK55I_18505, partial [bacterium]